MVVPAQRGLQDSLDLPDPRATQDLRDRLGLAEPLDKLDLLVN